MIQDNIFLTSGVKSWWISNNSVKHDKWDWSSDTSLYLKYSKNIFNVCYVTYSPRVTLAAFQKIFNDFI